MPKFGFLKIKSNFYYYHICMQKPSAIKINIAKNSWFHFAFSFLIFVYYKEKQQNWNCLILFLMCIRIYVWYDNKGT